MREWAIQRAKSAKSASTVCEIRSLPWLVVKGRAEKAAERPTRLKEHRYHAPSISVLPLLEMGTAVTETCAHLKTACQKLFPLTRSVFLRPHRAGHHLRSWRRAAGKALSTLRAMSGRALLALQSWISSEGVSLHLLRAREKQQRA